MFGARHTPPRRPSLTTTVCSSEYSPCEIKKALNMVADSSAESSPATTTCNLYPLVLDLSEYEYSDNCTCSPLQFLQDVTSSTNQLEEGVEVIQESTLQAMNNINDIPTVPDLTMSSTGSAVSTVHMLSQQNAPSNTSRNLNKHEKHTRRATVGGGIQDIVSSTIKSSSSLLSKKNDKKNKKKHHRRSISDSARTYILAESSQSSSIDDFRAEQGSFEDQYVLTRQIFRCENSCIWECVERESGHRRCVKMLSRDYNTNGDDEASMMQAAQSHPHVLDLQRVLTNRTRIFLISELMYGGNLLSHVIQAKNLREDKVRVYTYQILQALRHLHRRMCHNNLKPSNILLDAVESQIKIADFGSAVMIAEDDNERLRLSSTSTPYHAPERIASPEGDMWSVGMIVYFMLFGHDEIKNINDKEQILRKIHYEHPKGWKDISRQAKQFLTSLLHIDPNTRLTAQEALQHPWFQGTSVTSQVDDETRDETIMSNYHNNHRRHNSAGNTSTARTIVRSLTRITSWKRFTPSGGGIRTCKTEESNKY